MAQYASQQPQGFKNQIEKIAIVGAGGQCGKFIVEYLLKNGKHTITAITREGSTNKIPDGVIAKPVDYSNPSTLVEALKGHDALVITMSVTALPDQQTKLIDAAAEAGIPWILPNEFGGDGNNEEYGKDIMIGAQKRVFRNQIEKLGKSSWIGVACGFWYEYSLGAGPWTYGFDFANKEVTFFDEGTVRLNTSTWPQTGRAVANLLGLKVLPDNENDKSPCLAIYRNKFVYVSSFTLNQKEMFESVLRVTGTKESEWKISHENVQERYQAGVELLKTGNRIGFGKLLYSRTFYPDEPGLTEKTRGLDNEVLGLPKEELDEFTKEGIRLSESGYFSRH
ncbi:MAG: hypothetical protein MMC33_010336 [Icmadophila ericetorum]|nr:hypothetical protein [Icmadophila ericetorum]